MSIVVKDLAKVFPDGKQALKGVSLEFKNNQITGLIGFNGSGKTTTFNILSGFIEDFTGNISFDGKPLSMEIKAEISYLASGAEPKNPMKVLTHLYGIADLYNMKKSDARKIINNLSERIEFTQFLNSPIKALSKGNQQKIKIIAAFLNPNLKYLFLDEPFEGLDPIIVKKIEKIFLELKDITVIITSHQMDVVQSLCKEFYVLKEGVMVSSRSTAEKKIMMGVNKEVPLDKIKTMKQVLQIITTREKENVIVIDKIENFKVINKELMKHDEYVYSSLKEVNLAQEVFDSYGI